MLDQADELAAIALARFDIQGDGHKSDYLAVESLQSVFSEASAKATDLCDLIKIIVSTSKQCGLLNFEPSQIIQHLLEIDMLYRLFESSHCVSELLCVKKSARFSIAPLTMAVFDQRRSGKSRYDWPHPLAINGELDMPLICEYFADYTEPQALLFGISSFADRIAALATRSHTFNATQANAIIGRHLTMVEQKLSRWGVLL